MLIWSKNGSGTAYVPETWSLIQMSHKDSLSRMALQKKNHGPGDRTPKANTTVRIGDPRAQGSKDGVARAWNVCKNVALRDTEVEKMKIYS